MRFENAFYICTPQNRESSLRDWEGNWEKETKKKVSNFFKFFLRETKRSFSFAPALRDKRNKRKHVRRHIELTAVLRVILKQQNKSNRIDRFEKTTRIKHRDIILKYTMKSLILAQDER